MNESVSPAAKRVLQAIADLSHEGAVTLHHLVERLGGHPNTTRQQLERLVRGKLLDVSAVSQGLPGRPPKAYTLTQSGRRALGDQHYAGLVGAVTSHLADLPQPRAAARSLGEKWGRGTVVGEPADEPVAAVVELLDILGFEPRPLGTGDDVVLTSCPLLSGSEHSPLACEMHQGMLDGALRELGHAQGVLLVPYSHPDGCAVRFNAPVRAQADPPHPGALDDG